MLIFCWLVLLSLWRFGFRMVFLLFLFFIGEVFFFGFLDFYCFIVLKFVMEIGVVCWVLLFEFNGIMEEEGGGGMNVCVFFWLMGFIGNIGL